MPEIVVRIQWPEPHQVTETKGLREPTCPEDEDKFRPPSERGMEIALNLFFERPFRVTTLYRAYLVEKERGPIPQKERGKENGTSGCSAS